MIQYDSGSMTIVRDVNIWNTWKERAEESFGDP